MKEVEKTMRNVQICNAKWFAPFRHSLKVLCGRLIWFKIHVEGVVVVSVCRACVVAIAFAASACASARWNVLRLGEHTLEVIRCDSLAFYETLNFCVARLAQLGYPSNNCFSVSKGVKRGIRRRCTRRRCTSRRATRWDLGGGNAPPKVTLRGPQRRPHRWVSWETLHMGVLGSSVHI